MSSRGDLTVHLKGDQSGFQATLNAARHEAKKLGEEWSAQSLGTRLIQGGAAFLGFEAIKSSFESFLNRAAGLRELSEQLEMSVEATQKWTQATDDANLSLGKMQGILTAIQQKRMEAISNPDTADLFDKLGIPRQAVLDREGVGGDMFARMVLGAGRESDEKMQALIDLAGPGAKKYSAISGSVGDKKPYITEEAAEMAHHAHLLEQQFSGHYDNFWSKFITGLKQLRDGLNSETGQGWWHGSNYQPPVKTKSPILGGQMYDHPIGPTKPGDLSDPLVKARADRLATIQDRVDNAQESQRKAERGLMSIDQRRLDVMREILRIRRRIEDVEGREMPENLSPIKQAEWKAHQQEELAALRGRSAEYRHELMERPLSFQADNLSQVGLYSQSTVEYNPLVNIQQQQLAQLHAIRQNTANRGDIHSW